MLAICTVICVLAQLASGMEVDAVTTLTALIPIAVECGLSDLVQMARLIIMVGEASIAAGFLVYMQLKVHEARRAAGHAAHHRHHHPYRRHAPRNRRYKHLNWQEDSEFVTEAEFKSAYGVSRATFGKILDKIGGFLKDKPRRRGGRPSSPMAPELKLAMTLRWLRGGQYIDVKKIYGCSKITFYRVAYTVMEAICATHSLELIDAINEYQVRRDDSRLRRIAIGFARFTDGVILADGVIFASAAGAAAEPSLFDVGDAVAPAPPVAATPPPTAPLDTPADSLFADLDVSDQPSPEP